MGNNFATGVQSISQNASKTLSVKHIKQHTKLNTFQQNDEDFSQATNSDYKQSFESSSAGYLTSRKPKIDIASTASHSQHQPSQAKYIIKVYYNEHHNQKNEESVEFTSSWLFSEVIRNLQQLSHSQISEQLVPISISTKDKESECIDYYLTKINEPIKNFLTFKLSKSENLNFCEQHLQINFVSIDEIRQEALNEKQKQSYLPTLKDFDLIKVIGTGGFSQVLMVRKRTTGKLYAIKVINKKHIVDTQKVDQIISERKILSMLNHPFIVELHWAFTSKNYLFLVLDLCPGGELFYYITKYRRFSEEKAKIYFAEVLMAVEFLHQNNILYRDLKPENILIDEKGHIKLTDFGLSKMNFQQYDKSYSFCGSPEYMSPEMLNDLGHGRTVDIYCLGVLLYELLTGLPPHYNHDRMKMYQDIATLPIRFPKNLSTQAIDILRKMLDKDPQKRIGYKNGIQEIKEHPFCSDIDWNAIYTKEVQPPIKVKIGSSNFDTEYTKQKIDFLDLTKEDESGTSLTHDIRQSKITKRLHRINSHSHLKISILDTKQLNITKNIKNNYKQYLTTKAKDSISQQVDKQDDINFTDQARNSELKLQSSKIFQYQTNQIQSPTFQEFEYQKKLKIPQVEQEDVDQDQVRIVRMNSIEQKTIEDMNFIGRTFPSILTEHVDQLEANIRSMHTSALKANQISQYQNSSDQNKLYNSKCQEGQELIQEVDEEILLLSLESRDENYKKSEKSVSCDKSDHPFIELKSKNNQEENEHFNRLSFASANSPQTKGNINQILEENFLWNKNYIGTSRNLSKQMDVFSALTKRNTTKMLPNFKQMAVIMEKQKLGKYITTNFDDYSKRISTNFLTFTEKANGVISERKRETNIQSGSSQGSDSITQNQLKGLEKTIIKETQETNISSNKNKKDSPVILHPLFRPESTPSKQPIKPEEDIDLLSPVNRQKKNTKPISRVSLSTSTKKKSENYRSKVNQIPFNGSISSQPWQTKQVNSSLVGTVKTELQGINQKNSKQQKQKKQQDITPTFSKTMNTLNILFEKQTQPSNKTSYTSNLNFTNNQNFQNKIMKPSNFTNANKKSRNSNLHGKTNSTQPNMKSENSNPFPLFQTIQSSKQKVYQGNKQDTFLSMFKTTESRVSETAILNKSKNASPFTKKETYIDKNQKPQQNYHEQNKVQQGKFKKGTKVSSKIEFNKSITRQKSPQPTSQNNIIPQVSFPKKQHSNQSNVTHIQNVDGLTSQPQRIVKFVGNVQKVKESEIAKKVSLNSSKIHQQVQTSPKVKNSNTASTQMTAFPASFRQLLTDTIEVSFVKDGILTIHKQSSLYKKTQTESELESSITEFDVGIFDSTLNYNRSLAKSKKSLVKNASQRDITYFASSQNLQNQMEQEGKCQSSNEVEVISTGDYLTQQNSEQRKSETTSVFYQKNNMFTQRRGTYQDAYSYNIPNKFNIEKNQSKVSPGNSRLQMYSNKMFNGLFSPPLKTISNENEISQTKTKETQHLGNKKHSVTSAVSNSKQGSKILSQTTNSPVMRQTNFSQKKQGKIQNKLQKLQDVIEKTSKAVKGTQRLFE